MMAVTEDAYLSGRKIFVPESATERMTPSIGIHVRRYASGMSDAVVLVMATLHRIATVPSSRATDSRLFALLWYSDVSSARSSVTHPASRRLIVAMTTANLFHCPSLPTLLSSLIVTSIIEVFVYDSMLHAPSNRMTTSATATLPI